MTESFGLSPAFLDRGTSSFAEFVSRTYPQLLPDRDTKADAELAPHGTTIVAVKYSGGVVLAGDRRATMGNVIAQRDIDKIFSADCC